MAEVSPEVGVGIWEEVVSLQEEVDIVVATEAIVDEDIPHIREKRRWILSYPRIEEYFHAGDGP